MKRRYEIHDFCQSHWDNNKKKKLIQGSLDKNVDIDLINDEGETALTCAIKEDNIHVVEYLLSKNVNPNLSAPESLPPLVWAVIMDGTQSVTFTSALLKHPFIDVDQHQKHQITALYLAAQNGNINIIDLLIKKGALPIEAKIEDQYQSCLRIAIANGHPLAARKLLNKFPELANSCTENEQSVLYIAASYGYTNCIDLLIEHGANVNALFEMGTPLYAAAQNGYHEIVDKLLKNGADFELISRRDSEGGGIAPLHIAAIHGHVKVIELLLSNVHTKNSLKRAMHYTTNDMLACNDEAKRQRYHTCAQLIKNKLSTLPADKILNLNHGNLLLRGIFNNLFPDQTLFNNKLPGNKDAAIRNAHAAMYLLMTNPKACIPYIECLNKELEYQWQQWQKEREGKAFPTFDLNQIELWSHQGLIWPIPNEQFQEVKKFNLLQTILLNKFKQYGMGEEQSKWTGFLPKSKSKSLLLKNSFFTEDKLTINGLFHGDMHNIQRVILLYAIESDEIPLSYINDDGQKAQLEPKDIFSALVRTGVNKEVMWSKLLDSGWTDVLSFTHPFQLHSILLTHEKFSGILQDYMRYSFCSHFIKMRQLFSHVYGYIFTNEIMCKLVSTLKFEAFMDVSEFAIQMNEKKVLTEVSTIDELRDGGRKWAIQPKHYEELKEPTMCFGQSRK